ncbi:MAG: NADH-quinone oxidoreductase subunit L [Planctomycetota bacterium]|jgi:NADH-quinone oxidoreductase subunit L
METPIILALAITVLPLCAFMVQVFFGRFLPRQGDWLPTTAVAGSLAMSLYLLITGVFGASDGMEPVQWTMNWISIGQASPFSVDFEVYVDNLTVIMLCVVTLVSFLVHLFSTGYMHGEERYNRFFAYLALFTFSMLGLIITSSILFLFIFWELVGVCSYFLIGFYFQKDSAAAACKKAFLTNRVGDTGFFIGLMILWVTVDSFSFPEIFASLSDGTWAGKETLLTVCGLLIFTGAVSKSAQFPLHVWLPDAMEGPTPVSALIHAATMVAAGVYMICRMFPLLAGIDPVTGGAAMLSGNYFDSDALFIIALVGGFTALFAATIAIPQNDIKKVLAYSTVSQLGYMVMAVGVGSMYAAMFHLFTHAMFKACLFLGSGSVIHAMHHEQDMRKMGGLRHKLPITYLTYLVSTLALAGFPLTSGMISKESILTQAYAYWQWHDGSFVRMLPFLFCLLAAGLTAFYMFRLVIGVFYGKPRDQHAYDHAHESPKSMTIPLIVLAVIGVFGAGIAFPGGPGTHWFEDRAKPEVLVGKMMTDPDIVKDQATLARWSGTDHWHQLHDAPAATATSAVKEFHDLYHHAHWPTFFMATGIGLFGIAFAFYVFYFRREKTWVKEGGILDWYKGILMNYYYVDEFFAAVPIALMHWFSKVCFLIDRVIVDGLVNASSVVVRIVSWCVGKFDYHAVDGTVRGSGEAAFMIGKKVRQIQNGRIQDYVGFTVYGLAVVFLILAAWSNWS